MIATAHNRAGELALEIYAEALISVRADRLIDRSVQRDGTRLLIQDRCLELDSFQRIFVCGSGKASFGMAQSLVELLGDRVSGGLVVTKHGHGGSMTGIQILEASHPLPDATSVEAGGRMLEFASRLNERDLVLYALSGGTSALLETPLSGVTLEQISSVTTILLESGANIDELNCLRSALSATKRGKLAEAFAPSTVEVLVISDVDGNDLRTIGSGPFWRDALISRSSDQTEPKGEGAESVLKPVAIARQFRLNSRLGFDIESFLSRQAIPEDMNLKVRHSIVGSSANFAMAAIAGAESRGLTQARYAETEGGTSLGHVLRDDARKEAIRVANDAVRDTTAPATFAVYSGEPTVVVRGNGLGGRCQELAVTAAPLIVGQPDLAILAGSSDGTDGPTDAAGALVDGSSESRARQNGISAENALANSDSYRFLVACEGLIKTGPTQSNVNDIVLVIRSS